MDDNGWNEYKLLVMSKLEEMHEDQKLIWKRVCKIETDISSLKAKSGIWGVIGGLLAGISILLISFIKALWE